MPTISQLPAAGTITAADAIPVSQAGAVRATSVGALLATTQPAILIEPTSLLGRVSLGSGGPEQIQIGPGITLASGTLVANGSDHATFSTVQTLTPTTDLVATTQGSSVLVPATLLRSLFSAGPNVTIDATGTISANATVASTGALGTSFGALPAVTSPSAPDLVPISHGGTVSTVTYANLLGGITIDQAQAAMPASDSDTLWVAQGGNVMSYQTFSAIWAWLTGKMPSYKAPVVEVSSNTNLDTTVHNGRILVCSQPVTLTPQAANMGSGFSCQIINASSATVTLASGFVTSTGNYSLAPWQTATVSCITYSAGTITYATMPAPTVATGQTTVSVPNQVTGLAGTAASSSSVQISWTAQTGANAATSFAIQYRLSGSTAWTAGQTGVTAATATVTGLQASTAYDFTVLPVNATGIGPVSATVTVTTQAASGSVSSITWNVTPSGTYTHGSGVIAIKGSVG